jgi:hypothetical protein
MTTMLYYEDWDATYGSPYLIDEAEAAEGSAELAEPIPAGGFGLDPVAGDQGRVAFVDGVRRGEGLLYRRGSAGALVRGVAGAHACGAALCEPGRRPVIDHVATRRLVIFGGGEPVQLPAIDGYAWDRAAIASTELEAPRAELQRRMREAESRLAEALAREGWLVIADGPLYFIRSRDLPVVGYVKTHMRVLLEPGLHARVPEIGCGQRTPLFALGSDRYSAYARICEPAPHASPWRGIVRVELPQSQGLSAAATTADAVTRLLPRFAGIAHRDPRAPQNLQPIGVLERVLTHRLGAARLAKRAVRLAVAASVRAPAAFATST